MTEIHFQFLATWASLAICDIGFNLMQTWHDVATTDLLPDTAGCYSQVETPSSNQQHRDSMTLRDLITDSVNSPSESKRDPVRGGSYLPYSRKWAWLVHCFWSHIPDNGPRFYPSLPWSRFHGNYISTETQHISQTIRYSRNRNSWQIAVSLGISWKEQKKKREKQKYSCTLWMVSLEWDYLRMASETFCFHGLSLRIPIPNPERKNSSPVVTRSHFCEASNSNTAESQINAWSLLWVEKSIHKKTFLLFLSLFVIPFVDFLNMSIMLIKANMFWWKFKRICLCNNVKYFTATYDQSIKHKFQNVLVFCSPFALMTAANKLH